MGTFIGNTLDRIGLYRPLIQIHRTFFDPRQRLRRAEILLDLQQTRKDVTKWAREIHTNSAAAPAYGILSFTNLPLHAKIQCLAGKVMQLQGCTPLVFTYSEFEFGKKYFSDFGIDQMIDWDTYAAEKGPEFRAAQAEASRLAREADSVTSALAIQFHDVNVGKHALSVTCRRRVEGKLDLLDPQVKSVFEKHLQLAIQAVLAAERLFDSRPFRGLLVRDVGYIPNGPIFEVALQRGIDCICYEQGQRRGTWIFKRYDRRNFGQHYFSLSAGTWDEVRTKTWTDKDAARLAAEFAGRYQVDSMDDTRRLQSGKTLKSPEAVRQQLRLDPAKRTAVIFSHVAWDGAFFFGSCLFNDFEDWLYQTVKHVAGHCPELNWIIKLHPFNVFKLQRESKKEESEMRLLRPLMPLPAHVHLMRSDTDINTQSLFPVIDYALTVNGTVGMEFPCHGVPTILAGRGRYDGKGFTLEPASRQEYFQLLEQLHTVPRLSQETIELACKHYLAVTLGRQFSFEDVAEVELKRINEAVSDVHDNLRFKPASAPDFAGAASVRHFGDWMFKSGSPDLMAPEA